MFTTNIIPAVVSASNAHDASPSPSGEAFLVALLIMSVAAGSIVYLAMVLLNEGFKAFMVAIAFLIAWILVIITTLVLCLHFINF